MRTILAVGQDDGLLHSRAEVLRKSSTDVEVSAARLQQAIDLLQEQTFDLVVMCHTLDLDQLIEVASVARASNADAKVLQIANPINSRISYYEVLVDEIASNDPGSMLAKVRGLLQNPH